MTGGDGGVGPNNYTITMQGAAAVMDRPECCILTMFAD